MSGWVSGAVLQTTGGGTGTGTNGCGFHTIHMDYLGSNTNWHLGAECV